MVLTKLKPLFSLILFTVMTSPVFATTTGLPWEAPLDKIKDSLLGPVGMGIALIGVVVAGSTLLFGGEIGDFARKGINAALAISFILGASSFITTLFGNGGALF